VKYGNSVMLEYVFSMKKKMFSLMKHVTS